MVLAGIMAQGETSILNEEIIARGYTNIVNKLKAIGVHIEAINVK